MRGFGDRRDHILAQRGGPGGSVFDQAPPPNGGSPAAGDKGGAPAPQEGRGGILDKLQPAPSGPAVPQSR